MQKIEINTPEPEKAIPVLKDAILFWIGTHPIFNDLQATVNIMKQIEAETQQELNAILPPILDKAFRGEL
jgi:hypothetical protein